MTVQTQTPKGRQLREVRYATTCPDCGAGLPKGYQAAWYVTKTESRSGKAEVFCDRRHATNHYPVPAAPQPGRANTPAPVEPEEIKVIPEPAPAPVVEVEPGVPCPWTAETLTLDGVTIQLKGKHRQLALVVTAVWADTNVLLVGPAGSGKSTLARQAHDALVEIRGGRSKGWVSLSLASDTPSSKLFGYKNADGHFVPVPFYGNYTGDGAEPGTTLVDELDNGGASLVTGLNQALANDEAAFANGNAARHPDARVIATANTFGKGGDRLYVSRQQLDAASLDRFVTIEVEYDETLEYDLTLAAAPEVPKAILWDLISTVRQARDRACEKKLPLVFSPRACIDGAKLLAAGVPFDIVLDIRVFAGVSTDVRAGLQ